MIFIFSCSPRLTRLSNEPSKKMDSEYAPFSIKVPDHWNKMILNKNAQLNAGSNLSNQFLLIFRELKSDLSAMNLSKYSEITREGLFNNLKNAKFVQTNRTSIMGTPCIQYRIKGRYNNMDIVYLQTVLDTETAYYQLTMWTDGSNYRQSDPIFNNILDTFAEEKLEITSNHRFKSVNWLNNMFTIEVPNTWIYIELHDEADLEIGNESNSQYLVVLSENKKDFHNMDLETYSENAIGGVLSSLQDSTIIGPIDTSISNIDFQKYYLSGSYDNININYTFVNIESKTHYHQFMMWSIKSQYKKTKDLFEKIVNSFKYIE